MDFNVIFEIFDKYGWWSLLGIGAIGGMYLLFKYLGNKITGDVTDGMEKIADRMTQSISEQNKELVNGISSQNEKLIDYIINGKSNIIETHNDMVEERMNLADEINFKLKDIMQIHNSQRSYIIEFHNSVTNLSGIPFAKYSCTYEWFEKGLLPLSNKCTGLPFSSIARIVKDLLQSYNNQIVYTNMKEMEDNNPSLFNIFGDSQTKILVYTCMFDNKNTLIGILCIEYKNDYDINDINLNEIRLETAELTSILNLRYKYQQTNGTIEQYI